MKTKLYDFKTKKEIHMNQQISVLQTKKEDHMKQNNAEDLLKSEHFVPNSFIFSQTKREDYMKQNNAEDLLKSEHFVLNSILFSQILSPLSKKEGTLAVLDKSQIRLILILSYFLKKNNKKISDMENKNATHFHKHANLYPKIIIKSSEFCKEFFQKKKLIGYEKQRLIKVLDSFQNQELEFFYPIENPETKKIVEKTPISTPLIPKYKIEKQNLIIKFFPYLSLRDNEKYFKVSKKDFESLYQNQNKNNLKVSHLKLFLYLQRHLSISIWNDQVMLKKETLCRLLNLEKFVNERNKLKATQKIEEVLEVCKRIGFVKSWKKKEETYKIFLKKPNIKTK